MKIINLEVKLPIIKTDSKKLNLNKGKRVIIRNKEGIFIGTIIESSSSNTKVKLDSGIEVNFCDSLSIICEGINRKKKSAIPDDELYQWKKDLGCASMRKINFNKSKGE